MRLGEPEEEMDGEGGSSKKKKKNSRASRHCGIVFGSVITLFCWSLYDALLFESVSGFVLQHGGM